MTSHECVLNPGALALSQIELALNTSSIFVLHSTTFAAIDASASTVSRIAASGVPAYGINTGFGRLASTHIPRDQLEILQRNLVLSHAVGVGEPMSLNVVRLMMVLKVASLARGYSGVRREVIDALLALINRNVIPLIPEKGSVGASGDLAPLAHMAAVLLGVGDAFVHGQRVSAEAGLRAAGLTPMTFAAKEGLALLNGTQASTALAIAALITIERLLRTAVVSGALSVDAAAGSVLPFDERIHALRGQRGQIECAAAYRKLLTGSAINLSHRDCGKVQDPYSLRCQPQVMGACLDQLHHAAQTLLIEANAVSDNPLVFSDTDEVLSGGNFHAEPVALAADAMALVIAEIGALAERRIALLIDATLSGLPPFLVKDGGVNSGFMIAHVTAAALASENKSLAHPASVDSLPTSANQEDHVSMATFAARRLNAMAYNTSVILAIELLAAAQGIELRSPHATSPALQRVVNVIRKQVPHYDLDRYFAPDIDAIQKLVMEGTIADECPRDIGLVR